MRIKVFYEDASIDIPSLILEDVVWFDFYANDHLLEICRSNNVHNSFNYVQVIEVTD